MKDEVERRLPGSDPALWPGMVKVAMDEFKAKPEGQGLHEAGKAFSELEYFAGSTRDFYGTPEGRKKIQADLLKCVVAGVIRPLSPEDLSMCRALNVSAEEFLLARQGWLDDPSVGPDDEEDEA